MNFGITTFIINVFWFNFKDFCHFIIFHLLSLSLDKLSKLSTLEKENPSETISLFADLICYPWNPAIAHKYSDNFPSLTIFKPLLFEH